MLLSQADSKLTQSINRKTHPYGYLVFSIVLLVGYLTSIFVPTAMAEAESVRSLRNLGNNFADIVEKVSPAVVFIKVEQKVEGQMGYTNNPFELFNDDFMRRFFGQRFQQQQAPRQDQIVMGQGSGFIISKDGYILTNNHVAGKAEKITVKLLNGREVEARLIGTDPHSDVAVIKIDAGDLPFLTLGDSDNLRVGEWVLAVGNPFGLSHTVTAGIVSAKGRSSVGIADYEDFIQTDAAINPGNSGGPLLDLDGRVVGINTAIFSKNGGYMGIGFTIPINMVKVIRDQLIANGKVERGYLGITMQNLNPELAKSFGLKDKKGIVVSDVLKNSPADKAGIKRGDVIDKLDGKKIEDMSKFRNQIAMIAPGKKAVLGLWRDGNHRSVVALIAKRPNQDQIDSGDRNRLQKLGITLTALTPQLAEQFGYVGTSGVLITSVQNGSQAAWSGLRPGMLIQEINQKPVNSVSDFLAQLPEKGQVLLLVRAGQQSMFLTLTLK